MQRPRLAVVVPLDKTKLVSRVKVSWTSGPGGHNLARWVMCIGM